ncbi:MAG: hypothetical protein R2764_24925 [Bacteroidales bacterium]
MRTSTLVTYTEDAIKACVNLTTYITDRYLPDKAIDALDGSRVRACTLPTFVISVEIIDIENRIEETKQNKTKAINSKNLKKVCQVQGY